MRRIDPAKLRIALEQLERAEHDHTQWHDDLLRTIIFDLPCAAGDLAANAHQRCRLGQWYYGRASDEFREKPAFDAMEREHRRLHQAGARMLRAAASGAPILRADYEELVAGGTQLHMALAALRQEIQAVLSDRDALTGAFGRAGMLPDLQQWHALAKRGVQQCCIAFMDLDHLKAINDRYGHHLGDAVLAGAVRYLGNCLRPYDKLFRYGGDEFLISMPGTDLGIARTVIARVREGLSRSGLAVGPDGAAVRVSASFGIALLDPQVPVEESIQRADQALMLAKSAGRNRAICWDSSVTTGTRLPRLQIDDAKR